MSSTAASIETAFADALRAAGYSPPPDIIADGEIHRFSTNARRNDTAGWYVLHADEPITGTFGDWRKGDVQKWHRNGCAPLSDAEKRLQRQRWADAKIRAGAQQLQEQQSAADQAKHLWESAKPAPSDHPYLLRKGVQPYGLRVDDHDRLLVPMFLGDEIASIQTIAPDGTKRFQKDGRKKGTAYLIPGDPHGPIIVAEGFATGAAIAEATGWSVAVAFDAGNLEPASKAVKASSPAAPIIIAADNDASGAGRIKADAAAKAVGAACVIMPQDVGSDWNDHAAEHGLGSVREAFRSIFLSPHSGLRATPFHMPDPAAIPKREWVYGHHLIRKFVGLTVAPGATGKSSLLVADALALATGRDLLGVPVYGGPKKVWLWNLEDPKDELTRRIAAVAMHYAIHADELEGNLFVDSGREQGLCLAQQTKDGTQILEPVAEALEAELKARQIDVLIIDPFVSSHQVSENDNGAIDAVVKRWGTIADRTGCAIEIVHHLRKSNGMEANAESARGAVSLVAAARSVRVLNRMSDSEAVNAGLESPKGFFKVFDDKNNLAPAADRSDWYKIVPVTLPNGDGVGVVTRWSWPDPFVEVSVSDLAAVQRAVHGQNYRANSQAENWAGNVVAEVLGLDIQEPRVKSKIKALLKTWLGNGALVENKVKDQARKNRPIIDVGRWADDADAPLGEVEWSTAEQAARSVATPHCATSTTPI